MSTPDAVKATIKEGRIDDALTALKEAIRKSPGNATLRISLFELFCIEGDWDRAEGQLDVLKNLGQEDFYDLFKKVVSAEKRREKVFSDESSPPPLAQGENPAWLCDLVEANRLMISRDSEESERLRQRSFDQAPQSAGIINEEPFAIIGDADSRFGPSIEMIIGDQYFWAPFSRVQVIEFEPPEFVRDLVWKPATITLTTDQPRRGFVPTRYPGTAGGSAVDSSLKLARRTEWISDGTGPERGIGQRLLATDQSDYPILEVNKIVMEGSS